MQLRSVGARNATERLRHHRITDACDIASARMSDTRRDVQRRRMHKWILAIIRRYKNHHTIGKFMGKLGRALPNLFWFVIYPSIQPTNNTAKRGPREIIVHRKICGSIRAEGTMTWMGNRFSCVSTWKNHGLDCLQEIARYV